MIDANVILYPTPKGIPKNTGSMNTTNVITHRSALLIRSYQFGKLSGSMFGLVG
jgi:hypothetical protein